MPYDTIATRCLTAVRDAIAALDLPGAAPAAIVVRKNFLADGLTPPACVVSPAAHVPKRSPAGLRRRDVVCLVSLYFAGNRELVGDYAEQTYWVEAISAALHLPPTLPAALTAAVPEIEESRVRPGDTFVPAMYRYQVDAHRLAVLLEVCHAAGAVV